MIYPYLELTEYYLSSSKSFLILLTCLNLITILSCSQLKLILSDLMLSLLSQSVGQIVGEVLRQLTEEKFIVKATNGPRYVVGCR